MLRDRRVLLVEDEKADIAAISGLLKSLGAVVRCVSNVADAFQAIASEAFDYVLSDLHIESRSGLERPDGLDVIAHARQLQPNAVIVAASSDPRSDIWKEAEKSGAQHFVRKPLSRPDELTIAFGLARDRKLLTVPTQPTVNPFGRWSHYAEQYPDGIVLEKNLFNKIRGIARYTDKVCIITGETGTGKEEVAKLIHRFRSQKEGHIPFVAVNCATITQGLAESLLFGHRRGAFTGADSTTNGFVGDADRGILFLDEIHTLDLTVQQKLLRVLNDGSYNRLGETKTYHSKFQLVAASVKDLDDAVDEGRFLVDLRTRMMGVDLALKPLRERTEDIPALVALFLAKRNLNISDGLFSSLTEHLQNFYWRGNIRQLFKALESWILNCEFDEVPLSLENFPVFKGMQSSVESKPKVSIASFEGASRYDANQVFSQDIPLEVALEQYERRIIEATLLRHESIIAAAKALNLPRSTLDNKRRKFGLNL